MFLYRVNLTAFRFTIKKYQAKSWLLHNIGMATPQELANFLEEIEKRAFKTAFYAVRNEEHALDIVQDTMIKLAENYGDKPQPELLPLFQRILHNTINDFFRRQKVRNLWVSLFSSLQNQQDYDDEVDDCIW